MDKIKLIIAREYVTKIRTKAFIIITLLGPFLYGGIIFSSVLMAKYAASKQKQVQIVDESGKFSNLQMPEGNNSLRITMLNSSREEVKKAMEAELLETMVVFIPANIMENGVSVEMYYRDPPGPATQGAILDLLEERWKDVKIQESGLDKEVIASLNPEIDINQFKIGKEGMEKSSSGVASAVGFITGFLLYFFIFVYGSMVLRGVQEEKQSRIVEVIISSVRPFQLMMGKIIGNALLALTQFAIWIMLSVIISVAVGATMGGDSMENAQMVQQSVNPAMSEMPAMDNMNIGAILSGIPIAKIAVFFMFYFLGGFLLYSSLFAAAAAAVDSQQDMQQFMLPLSIPMIIAMVSMSSVMEDPHGTLATVLSIFPFTSPVIMMARMPFEVPWIQIVISVVLLVLTFIFCVFIAAKIYRVGLLMYGSKPSWKQIWSWIFYKN